MCILFFDESLNINMFSISFLGGHTAEMLRLLEGLDLQKFSPRTYVVARTDDTSVKRVKQMETSQVSTSGSVRIYQHFL